MSFKRRGNDRNQYGGGYKRNRSTGGNYNRRPREMHKAVCSDCGNDCEVPFVPAEGKPVYCRDCFQKRRSF